MQGSKLTDLLKARRASSFLLERANHRLSTEQFILKSEKLAQQWVTQGLQKDQLVHIESADHFDFFLMLAAVWMAEAKALPMNPQIDPDSKTQILEHCSPQWSVGGSPSEGYTLECRTLKSELNTLADLILFTSGSTGVPKGVPLSQHQVIENATRTLKILRMTEDDKLMINTPPYFVSGLNHFLCTVASGASLYVEESAFFGKQIFEAIENSQATGFGGAPAHFTRMFEVEDEFSKTNLSFMVSSGDHLAPELIDKALNRLPDLDLYVMYGLTELSGRLCVLEPEYIGKKKGSVGRPIDRMRLKIIDELGNEVAYGEVGEVAVRGDLAITHYLNAEAPIDDESYFKTGDYAWMDEDGFLYLIGRKDGVFKSGGEKVSTFKVQAALQNLGVFEDVAVLADEDDIMGACAHVYFRMKNRKSFERREVQKKLKRLLPRNHLPRKWTEVDELPRTLSGKLNRRKLFESLPSK